MSARRLLPTAMLLAACGDDEPSVQRDPNPAQAADAALADTGVDASTTRKDSAVASRDAETADSARGVPNVVPYPSCGGLAGLPCPAGEFCNQEMAPDGLGCGYADSLGSCASTTETCDEPAQVCGCDDETYPSRCAAHAVGASISKPGPCKADRETNCDERDVICKRARPACTEGKVPVVVEGCWGECVKIDDCACHAAYECPEPEQYVCHMSAQHCGPYVN
ncbi:MAG TPA: hypothetical protein VFX59_08525 [Polyangiales bacterium]|nr:hypothetical protein [Polyangiales bacterium]